MLRYKFVFHYTNGTSATVRNISSIALVDVRGEESHPADLLLILDKDNKTTPVGKVKISRTILSGEVLCDDLQKVEVYTRELTKRSRYTESDEATYLAQELIARLNLAIKRKASDSFPKLKYNRDRLPGYAGRFVDKVLTIS